MSGLNNSSSSRTDIQFMPDTYAAEVESLPITTHAILWITAVFVLVAIVWANFATLDEVAHAEGRGVFDGNVQVNRLAQRTDAGQLSRNLLLVPKATVNVKPNLQIVADDVVCTHGCAVSDLDDDQVFYFLSRGIDEATARASLVYSFGMEVVGRIRQEALRERLEAATRESLDACTSLS